MVFDISMFGIATFDCTCKSIDYPELGMVGIHYSSSLVWGTNSYNLFSEKLLKKTHKYVSISEYEHMMTHVHKQWVPEHQTNYNSAGQNTASNETSSTLKIIYELILYI